MNFFGSLELFAAMLYPYRLPLAILALGALAAAAWYARRRGWWSALARRRGRTAVVTAAIAVVAIPAGLYLLSPLWTRSMLVEVSPLEAESPALSVAPTSMPSAAPTSMPPADLRTLLRGEWRGSDDFHFARGHALIIETESGRYVLRVEQFSVRNGPDLFMYLSPGSSGYAPGAINLGSLKATDGAFNYEIPTGTDIEQFKSAVV